MYHAQLLVLTLFVARGVLAAPIHQFSDPSSQHAHGVDRRAPAPIHNWPESGIDHSERRRDPLAIGEFEDGTPIQDPPVNPPVPSYRY